MMRFATVLLAMLACVSSAGLTPTRLRCEYREAPIGMDDPVPRLEWINVAEA